MIYLRSGITFFIACQLISVGFSPTLVSSLSDMTLQEKALYISENNCEKVKDASTGPSVLFTGSHVSLVGRAKKIKDTYGPNNGRYSMTVTPQCIQKGDVSHDEIVVRNLGKTKCGSSDVEVGKDYLFFLRRTSDPKVYEAMNGGAKVVDGPVLWTPIFTMLCGLKENKKCKDGACPLGCNFVPPLDNKCIPTEPTVTDTFFGLYPEVFSKSTSAAPTTTTIPTTTTTQMKKEEEKKEETKKEMTTAAPDMEKTTISTEKTGNGEDKMITYAPEPKNQTKVEKSSNDDAEDDPKGQANNLCSNLRLLLSMLSVNLILSL